MSGDAPRTCGWCSRPTFGDVICPSCENLDQRAQPTRLHALPAGKWTKTGGVWRFKAAPPPRPRINECETCGAECRGDLCRDCWLASARKTTHEVGSHARFNKHVRSGERACDACRIAEREYQNSRPKKPRRRTKTQMEAA